MFEKYTETARRAVSSAASEARQFGSPCIDTEHLLLGILREDEALAHRFLHYYPSVDWFRAQVEDRTPRREPVADSAGLPFSEACQRLLEYAAQAAERMEHEHIHTEHLFLGLLSEPDSVAAEILEGRGLRLPTVRQQLEGSWQEKAHALRVKMRKVSEPRWPAFLAMGADALIHYALPDRISLGPRWSLFAVILVLLIPIVYSNRLGRPNVARVLTFVAVGALALALIGSLALLIEGLPQHKDPPGTLLISAALLWITNVLVFALWYWKLDAGGPLGREQANARSSFLFPQMMLPPALADPAWSPEFVDYLFLAFNTSTAFSPTDTAVLSRWAKGLMMVQSIISLSVVALLAARAINVL